MKSMVSSLFIMGILLFSMIFMIFPSFHEADAGSVWKLETDMDFKNGTMENVTIHVSGSLAELQLSNTSIAGAWANKAPLSAPSPRIHHAMAPVYGTKEVVMFGGYQKKIVSKKGIDIVLALDTSGSMTGSPLSDLKNAAKNFINHPMLDARDRVAIYTFESEAPVRQIDFTDCNISGKTQLINIIDGLTASGYTPLWDSIGESVKYAKTNGSTRIPFVLAMTDGEDYGNEGREDGSETYCPWHDWDDVGINVQYQNLGPSSGDDIFTHDGGGNPDSNSNWDWYNLDDENRYGLLNIRNVTVYTVGLGLDHTNHTGDSCYWFPNGWWGGYAKEEDKEHSWSGDYNQSRYNESGTPEFNLWRVAKSSSGKYYYASDSNKLNSIFQTIAGAIEEESTSGRSDTNGSRARIFFDGFETGNYNGGPWAVGSGWSVETTYQRSGIYYSLARGDYTDSSMALNTDLDLSNYEDVKLIVWHYTDDVENSDYFRIDVSTNSGSSWTNIRNWIGNQIEGTNYRREEISLKSYDGQSSFRFRFRFTMSSNWEYWSVDDVELQGNLSSGNQSIKTYINNETWVYDSTLNTWSQKHPSVDPSERRFQAMAPIHGFDKVLLFGGLTSNSTLSDETWVYDLSNNTWAQITPSTHPNARKYHAMASVYGTDKVVLFGGSNISAYNDTWIYDYSNNTWTKQAPKNSPAAFSRPVMASIFSKDKVLLYNGDSTETWVYDLSDNKWSNKHPSGNLSSDIGDIALASIHGTDKVLLYAGGYHYILNGETWVYDLSNNNWTQLTLSNYPGERTGFAMASIYGNTDIVLYGGGDDETWAFQLKSSYKPGNFISVQYDTSTNSSFKRISWSAMNSPNTNIKLQLRTSNTKSGLNTKSFVGPGGKSTNYYIASGSKIWSGHTPARWIQFKVYFNTNNPSETPRLRNITITYNNLPQTKLNSPQNNLRTSNNTPIFNWSFTDSDSDTQAAFQVLIDDNITFNSVDYDSSQLSLKNPYWNFTSGGKYKLLPDGIWYWKVRNKDSAGDWGEYSPPWKLIIDTDPPKSIIYKLQNNSYYNNLNDIFGIALGNIDGSLVIKVEISLEWIDNNTYWDGTGWVPAETWLLATGTGIWSYDFASVQWTTDNNYTIHSRALDNISNLEKPGVGITFMYDIKPPESSLLINNNSQFTNSTNVLLSLAATDSGSGVSKVAYSENRIEWSSWEKFNKTRHLNLSNGDGEKVIYFMVKDRANNSAITQNSIVLDTTPPHSLSISINNGQFITNSSTVTLDLYAKDDTSEVAEMAFSIDGKNWSTWEPYETERVFTLLGPEGEKVVYLKVKDIAGNIAEPVHAKIIFVKSVPSDSDRSKLDLELSPIFILLIVLIILLTAIILSFIIRNKHHHEKEEPMADSEKLLNKFKQEIYEENFTEDSELPKNEVLVKLESIHGKGEISNGTYEYIINFIENEKFK
jgi:hypothetical protein